MPEQRPSPSDSRAVIDYVRQRGTLLVNDVDVPSDFAGWRRELRRRAREIGIRLSVRRVDGAVLLYHPDHVVTKAEMRAAIEAVAAASDGTEFDHAAALRRHRPAGLRLVQGQVPNKPAT